MPLTRYIANTRHLCVYQLGSEYLYSKLIFPHVTTLTLIQCEAKGVDHIFSPMIFPQLRTVNYLSSAPTDTTIHRRFNHNILWAFPAISYPFYDRMVEAGYGYQNPDLVVNFIADRKKEKTHVVHDLYLPGYGIMEGNVYRSAAYDYFTNKDNMIYRTCTRHLIQYEYYTDVDHYSFEALRLYYPSQYYRKKKMEEEFLKETLYDC